MLNRRVLRVKAMQALYSYFMTQESLKEVVKERLESKFYPDPAKDDFTDADKFTVRRKTASRVFLESLANRKVDSKEELEDDIIQAVNSAIDEYFLELIRELKRIKSSMLSDVDNIFKLYLKLLSIPIELEHLEKLERAKKEKAHIHKESPWKWHFINNSVINDLTKSENFTSAIIDQKVAWTEDLDILKTWYKDILKNDETIQKYQHSESPTPAEDHEVIQYLFKKVIFKNESINESLSEMDLHWAENKPIIKSLVQKTFKDYEPDLDPPFELKEVNNNGSDDLEFFEELFDETIKKNAELDQLITDHIKNWDISRVATLDRIILKMAITEMTLFHGIPLKVTINEFIEISKQYSTPKSKQFINGILDVLANELTSKGVIRKSGRGLIDNK